MVDWISGVEVIFIDKDLLRFLVEYYLKFLWLEKFWGYVWFGIEIIFFVVYDNYRFMRKLFWYYR